MIAWKQNPKTGIYEKTDPDVVCSPADPEANLLAAVWNENVWAKYHRLDDTYALDIRDSGFVSCKDYPQRGTWRWQVRGYFGSEHKQSVAMESDEDVVMGAIIAATSIKAAKIEADKVLEDLKHKGIISSEILGLESLRRLKKRERQQEIDRDLNAFMDEHEVHS